MRKVLNDHCYQVLKTDLQLSDLEVQIFLIIITRGRLSIEQLSLNSNIEISSCKKILNSLINKKMIIEYSNNLFESFHPKFAIINRYKNLCLEKNIPFRKNIKIDNVALLLEKPFDIARTK